METNTNNIETASTTTFNRRRRIRPATLGIMAIMFVAASNSAQAAVTGKVKLHNHTDRYVTVVSNYWVNYSGRKIVTEYTWKLKPYATVIPVINNHKIYASNFGYRLKSTLGETPARSTGKVWFSSNVKNGYLDVHVYSHNLYPKKAKTSNRTANIQTARRQLDKRSNAQGILSFAHPTCKITRFNHEGTYDVVKKATGQKQHNHFVLRYKYNWYGQLLEDSGFTRMDFFFNEHGKIYQVKVVSDSADVKAFSASPIMLAMMRDKVLRDPNIRNNPVRVAKMKSLFNSGNAQAMLLYVLQLDQEISKA